MKLYLATLALSLMLLYLADTRITFSPFSISFGRGWLVLGYILISIGLKRGAEIKKEVIEEIKQEEIKMSI